MWPDNLYFPLSLISRHNRLTESGKTTMSDVGAHPEKFGHVSVVAFYDIDEYTSTTSPFSTYDEITKLREELQSASKNRLRLHSKTCVLRQLSKQSVVIDYDQARLEEFQLHGAHVHALSSHHQTLSTETCQLSIINFIFKNMSMSNKTASPQKGVITSASANGISA